MLQILELLAIWQQQTESYLGRERRVSDSQLLLLVLWTPVYTVFIQARQFW